PASSAGAATEAAGKEADQPDQRDHDSHDEQPMNDEAKAEQDHRQDRQCNQQQHFHPSLRPSGDSLSGSGRKTAKAPARLRTVRTLLPTRIESRLWPTST